MATIVNDLRERARENRVHPTTVQSLSAPFADAEFAEMTEHQLDEALASTLRVLRQIAGPEVASGALPRHRTIAHRDGNDFSHNAIRLRPEGAAPAPAPALGRALATPRGAGAQSRVVPSRKCREAACNKSDVGGGRCTSHGGGKRCAEPECDSGARKGGRCITHGGGTRCVEPDCGKTAADPRSSRCLKHGGGRLCDVPDCDRPRRVRSKCGVHAGVNTKPLCVEHRCRRKAIGEDGRCKAHGGKRRCKEDQCSNVAVSAKQGVCAKHARRRACVEHGCDSAALLRGVCSEHGGVRKRKRLCEEHDCEGVVVSGARCVRHGGGGSCGEPGCTKRNAGGGGAWRTAAVSGARRPGALAARLGARTA